MRRAVVVKLGSSTLVDARGRPRRALLSRARGRDREPGAAGVPVCVVSSGAIALGAAALDARPPGRRARACRRHRPSGRACCSAAWQRALARRRPRAGQVLLTASDIHARTSYLNARATLETLLGWGVVPVVNENDSTATDEITFGDNDALAAQVAVLLRARLLVLLTDQDGLYTREPRAPGAELVREVRDHRLLAAIDVDAPSPERPRLGRHALEDRRGRDGVGRRRGVRDRARAPARACSRTPSPAATSARASSPTRGRLRASSCGSATAGRARDG